MTASLHPGALVAGRYRVHERLGAGGMGVVHRATDTRIKRDVALKQVLLGGAGSADDHRRMLREAEIAARTHHPRIVTVFDVLDDADGPILVLEYLPSRSLAALVAADGLLTPAVTARAGAQIAEALAAAHAAGVVHRDVKPDNVLVGTGAPLGPVKLTDFGISQSSDAPLTASGIGTPAYFAPEIARGAVPAPASDVYALGATLLVVSRGTPPYGWGNGNSLELIRRIAQEPVPVPNPDGPLGELLARLVADDPDRRPTAADAASALWILADRHEPARAAEGTGPSTYAAPTVGPPGSGRRRRWLRRYRRGWLPAGAGVVLAAAVVGALLVTRHPVASFPTTVPPVTVGDDSTADPCSVVSMQDLERFGETILVPDYGYFASCSVGVRRGTEQIFVGTRLRPSLPDDPPGGDQQRLGSVLIVRYPASDDDSCSRNVVLNDGATISIDVSSDRPAPDACDIAESATASATTTLAESGIRRRVLPPTDLWRENACTLLGAADLSLLPADRRSPAYEDFGRWGCDWHDDGDPALKILLTFDRYTPPSQLREARRVPGTDAYVRDDGDEPGKCMAELPTHAFRSVLGKELNEELRVRVEGPLPQQELCDHAADLVLAAGRRV